MQENWPEPKRIVVGFLGVIGVLILAIVSMAWSRVEKNDVRIDKLEDVVPGINAHSQHIRDRLTGIEARLLSIEGKIDERNGH